MKASESTLIPTYILSSRCSPFLLLGHGDAANAASFSLPRSALKQHPDSVSLPVTDANIRARERQIRPNSSTIWGQKTKRHLLPTATIQRSPVPCSACDLLFLGICYSKAMSRRGPVW